MKSILLVEDDKNLSESLTRLIASEGFSVTPAATLAEAKTRLSENPSLFLLDWMLPDGQGIDFLRELRRTGNEAPVILLTSRNDLIDKVLGLETGANDYITKPFEPRELVARIRVQLRTSAQPAQAAKGPSSQAGISLDPVSREASYHGRKLELTKVEFDLLQLLLENPGRVFPREALLNKVWGYDNYPTTRTVDNHIVQLRQKTSPELFETVRGVGYRFRGDKR
jgi:DNA-binding response OmpR family regulator